MKAGECRIASVFYELKLKKKEWERLLKMNYHAEVIPVMKGTGADDYSLDYDEHTPNMVYFTVPGDGSPEKAVSALLKLVKETKKAEA